MVETAICSQKYRKVVFFAQIAILYSTVYLKLQSLLQQMGYKLKYTSSLGAPPEDVCTVLMCSLSQVPLLFQHTLVNLGARY